MAKAAAGSRRRQQAQQQEQQAPPDGASEPDQQQPQQQHAGAAAADMQQQQQDAQQQQQPLPPVPAPQQQPSSSTKKPSKRAKLLSAEKLRRLQDRAGRRGIVYLSRLPPHMKPAKLRQLLSAHGEIGRVYCTPEDAGARAVRKQRGGNSGASSLRVSCVWRGWMCWTQQLQLGAGVVWA
jgi:ESF2/ABP1 family protein